MERAVTYKNNGQINIILNGQKQVLANSEAEAEYQAALQKNEAKHSILKEIEREMNTLVGMEEMKRNIKEIYAWIFVNKKREEQGLKAGKQALHMMFKGNPGTGKTTVARLIGRLFYEMNVLSKGHLIEAERADLVGEYIGHTAQKTRDLIKKAMGGILFIDEAYSLARGGEKDFGKEAIDTLVKHMEDKRNEFILILAGYSREMDHFLSLNPGLQSRFPISIDFPDYSVSQLMDIAKRMMAEREYQFSPEAEWKLKDHLMAVKSTVSPAKFSNGRFVRNLIEKSIRSQAMRLLMGDCYLKNDLITIKSQDLDLKEDAPHV
ncbi:Stage V sporulation protein K [Bacillus paralicheniformis]|uniref:Stage V sporulation protein K n=1 Tax=Bacillus paralicheniformis TaxID=1648923 RepID=A0A6I7U2X0_9BACI|nr:MULTISPECIES: stage V sporulation protein K [Bacillus]AGN36413.1 stage V sporulation protein SpoVK [Bacillus paralicheniformis ATCC 9945a]ETB69284.1 stage V sporulation protein K [Bacillus sp. CPSM8]KUL07652.1 stage V sporulation protein K [Bacillus licheniformis LMG 7559]KUL12962.1 stage V sporulation protein K [Bacillus licheniformis LMG 17339]KUL16704.1 stage V sporulation protein K [Bacillus licheniformis LMG 6934]